MKRLFVVILILGSCNGRKDKGKIPIPKDSKQKETRIDTSSLAQDLFFRISDSVRDIQYIDSFFDLVYGSTEGVPLKSVQKFFPSNEEELAYLEMHIKNQGVKGRMTDSLDNESNFYKSKFFPALAGNIRSKIPMRSSVHVSFGGFDVIANGNEDPYDTTHVKYEVYDVKHTRMWTISIPYLRDNDYAIQNIYDKNGESLIEKICGNR